MQAPETLIRLTEPWASTYGDSAILPTLITFGHIAALVFAGGLAVTLDRGTLRAARGSSDERWRQLRELGAAHRLVVTGLALSVVTGILMFTADVEAYFGSWIYWTKMSLIALLLVNGYLMTRLETRIGLTPNAADDAGWRSLRLSATVSMLLWFAIAFAGVAVVNM
ncbi:MAG: hypothetical protein WD801_16420 [Gemmatimonadaceae bacterium]